MNRGRVVIAGGSVGGLTAGLLLGDLGLDVTIHERSPSELEQRGAGIGFLPDSYRYLVERAGVDLDEISVTTSRIRYLDRGGCIVHDRPHQYRFSSWNTVYRRLQACFDQRRYHLGSEVTGFVDAGDTVRVELAGGPVDADLLVCADGVGSPARRRLLPTVHPSYAGYVAWRGMTPEAQLDDHARRVFGDAITYFVFANSHILLYPIPGSDGSVRRGERLINFVWYRNYLDRGGDLDDLLTDAGGTRHDVSVPPGVVRAEHVAAMRAEARARLPEVIAGVVCSVDRPFVQVIYDVEVPRMAFGRVCLIGDAASVARPHAAAGTAKAAADGWALADAIAAHDDVPPALVAWESEQLALGRQLLDRTRRIGARSQVDCNWVPGDPELIFGLRGPGR